MNAPFTSGVQTPENAAPEHWIYAQADRDLSSEAMNFDGSRDDFIAKLSEEGILATPVHSCKQVAAVSKTNESKTLRFEKRESEGITLSTSSQSHSHYNHYHAGNNLILSELTISFPSRSLCLLSLWQHSHSNWASRVVDRNMEAYMVLFRWHSK